MFTHRAVLFTFVVLLVYIVSLLGKSGHVLERVTEDRASKCLQRIDVLSAIREEVWVTCCLDTVSMITTPVYLHT